MTNQTSRFHTCIDPGRCPIHASGPISVDPIFWHYIDFTEPYGEYNVSKAVFEQLGNEGLKKFIWELRRRYIHANNTHLSVRVAPRNSGIFITWRPIDSNHPLGTLDPCGVLETMDETQQPTLLQAIRERLGVSGSEVADEAAPKDDPVNHPKHYNSHPSGVECITIIRHYRANVAFAMKHMWRAGLKTLGGSALDMEIQDLEKAAFYLNDEIVELKRRREKSDDK